MDVSDRRSGDEVAAGQGGAGGLVTLGAGSAGAVLAAFHGTAPAAAQVPAPFSQVICLIPETRIAGTTHVPGIEGLADRLREGDRLTLQRDPDNRFDSWAICVLDPRGQRLGFVPADRNEIPARLMDGGKHLYGEVLDVELRGSWVRIGMAVYLDD